MSDPDGYDETDALETLRRLHLLVERYPSPQGQAFREPFTGFDLALLDLRDQAVAAPFRVAAARVERAALAAVDSATEEKRQSVALNALNVCAEHYAVQEYEVMKLARKPR